MHRIALHTTAAGRSRRYPQGLRRRRKHFAESSPRASTRVPQAAWITPQRRPRSASPRAPGPRPREPALELAAHDSACAGSAAGSRVARTAVAAGCANGWGSPTRRAPGLGRGSGAVERLRCVPSLKSPDAPKGRGVRSALDVRPVLAGSPFCARRCADPRPSAGRPRPGRASPRRPPRANRCRAGRGPSGGRGRSGARVGARGAGRRRGRVMLRRMREACVSAMRLPRS